MKWPDDFQRYIGPSTRCIPVVRYTRPDKFGSIYIPQAFDGDGTMTLWEYYEGWPLGPGGGRTADDSKPLDSALDTLGIRSFGSSILRTRSYWPTPTPFETESGEAIFFLDAKEVDAIIPME